jgi:hypothetical protein
MATRKPCPGCAMVDTRREADRVCAADVDRLYRRALELGQSILHLHGAPVDISAAPERRRCRICCGCTMERACPSWCW